MSTETTTPAPLYVPDYARSLENQSIGQIRQGIQGLQGIGKTWSALTYPNPVVLNFDRGLAAHIGRKDVIEIPFYDDKFINETLRVVNNTIDNRYQADRRPNRRDALLKFLHKEGHKFRPHQTMVIDSWTTVQNSFDIQTTYEPKITKSGEIDTFAFWREKQDFSMEVLEMIKTFDCNVVITFHETFERDKDDRIIGIRPLMQGKFVDQLSAHFTDWYRHKFIEVNHEKDGLNAKEKEILKEFTPQVVKGNMAFMWQVNKDGIALSCKTSRKHIPDGVRYIPGCYEAMMKYA